MRKALIVGMLLFGASQNLSAQENLPVTDSLDLMIGQMILTGLGDFNRLDKGAPVFEAIRTGKVGGVILFEKNLNSINTEENIQEILSYAQAQTEIPLLVSIDEEGGRVNRLKTKYGFPRTVTAQYLGNLDHPDSTSFYARQNRFYFVSIGYQHEFRAIC